MRYHSYQEAVLAKYQPSASSSQSLLTASGSMGKSREKAKKSFDDFYREVIAAGSQKDELNPYLGKNASEIETLMKQNRKLIESQYNPKKK